MTSSEKIVEGEAQMLPFDSVFENLKREIQNTMRYWSAGLEFPSLFETGGIRVPLCDISDRGKHYEIQIEMPGISKQKVKVKAADHSIEVTARRDQKVEKKDGYVYSELSKSSFFRLIPLTQEIVPSKVKSKVNNGIVRIEAPKKHRR